MLTVGLTGGMGSGKSTVGHFFLELNIVVIDADRVAFDISQKPDVSDKIVTHFGHTILNDKGQINRTQLRNIIFAHPHQRLWLEELLHPLIYQTLQSSIKQAKGPYCIVIIPLLLENLQDPNQKLLNIDRILLIDVPKDIQIERIRRRDQDSMKQIEKILRTQMSQVQRRKYADDLIINTGDLNELKQQVRQLDQYYRKLSLNLN
jgi:dephospho-CoA kinase